MGNTTDIIITGAGIIGTAIAFELGKKGYKTINIDKLPAAGQGSTGSSSAGIRTHYSTRDGVAMAYEGYLPWKNWQSYLGVADVRGLAKFKNTGGLVLGNESGKLPKLLSEVGVEFESWDMDLVRQKIPIYADFDFSPPRRPADETFFDRPSQKLNYAIYTPSSGYMTDPQLAAHNLQVAAETSGGPRFAAWPREFRVSEYLINPEDWLICMMYPTTGFPFMIKPIWQVFIWRSEPAATSSKPHRLSVG